MTLHLGYIPASSTIYIPFHTFNSSGGSVTISGLAVGDILIYKNGSTTERSSTAGFTLLDTDGIDFDGKTGLHGFKIDLSDNTDAGFYAAGNHYMVGVSTITADGQTVSFWAATFYIGPAEGDAVLAQVALVKAKTDSLTFTVAGQVDANIQYVNNALVTGTGALGDEWGP